MGRRKNERALKRVQLRLSRESAEVCDRLTSEEISEVLESALKAGIRPGKTLGAVVQAIMRPEKMRTRTIARISASENGLIQIQFPEKRDDFRNVVSLYGFRWNEWCWERKVETDVLCDRVAEIAHNLLLNKFVVQVDHSEIRDRAVTGRYEPEALRVVKTVTSGAYAGWFVFEYPRADDFYGDLIELTAAKYVDKRVRVPPEHFAEVEDFAEQNGFQFSPAAHEALEKARSLWESALLVLPASKRKQKKAVNPLDSEEVEIPDALKDDDA